MRHPKITVFLPTYNGERYLEGILHAVFEQEIDHDFEVLIIDSGSTDRTLEIIRKFPRIRLYEIANEEFQHGRTRNLAASMARGEIVVYLTQSSTPAHPRWLHNLTRHFAEETSVMAAYGKHLPRKGCNPYVAYDIEQAFRWVSSEDSVLKDRLGPGERLQALPQSERDRRRFLSNANSAIRKSFLDTHPFREVEYAEDQLMGVDVLEAGYTKAYDPEASVLHSHSFPLRTYYRRRFDEYWGLIATGEITTATGATRLAARVLARWRRILPWLYRSQRYSLMEKALWSAGALAYAVADSMSLASAQAAVNDPEKRRRLSLEARARGRDSTSAAGHTAGETPEIVLRKGQQTGAPQMALTVLKDEGPGQMLRKIYGFLRYGSSRKHAKRSAAPDGLANAFVIKNRPARDFKERPLPNGPLDIAWVIPDFGVGSGGHMNIFRAIRGLEVAGHTNRIYIMGESRWGDAASARRAIRKHFAPLLAEVFIGTSQIRDSDVCMATSWQTAYPVAAVTNTRKKIYFVQDWEAYFYPRSSEYALAEATYELGFSCITGGPWLAKKLREGYGLRAEHFTFAYDPKIYNRKELLKRRENSLLFYARPPTARRAFELGLLAIQLLLEENPTVEVGLFGWDCSNENVPFDFVNHGILTDGDLARLYNTYQVGFVCSLTNYSLVTQEMLACGMAAVDIDAEHTRACYKEGSVVLARPQPWDLAEKLGSLLSDQGFYRQTVARAEATATAIGGWEDQFAKIEGLIRDL